MKKYTSQAFETILVTNGKPQNIEHHQTRFERTQKELFETIPAQTLAEHIVAPDNNTYRCKVIYDAQILSCAFEPYKKKTITSLAIATSDISYPHKLLDRDGLGIIFSQKGMADDVIIAKDGMITDTTIANLAFFDGVDWLTPKEPLLKGTMRQKLLDDGFLKVANIEASSIKNYELIAIMNALRGFDILGKCDNIVLG